VSRRVVAACAAVAVVVAAGAGLAAVRGGNEDTAVLLAAGDIGECGNEGDDLTADLIADHPEATVAALGDLAYESGTPQEFQRCFGQSWGRFRERIRPATGNHDHDTEQASGFSGYFGPRGGPEGVFRYGYDLGQWRVLVLDSDCWRVGGCEKDDPQARWLRDQARASRDRCTLAYWHRPPFSSGRYGDKKDTRRIRAVWQVAVEEGVDVVLTGHEHSYERFAPMDISGRRYSRGPRLFIVGTGGAHLRPYRTPRLPTTEARNADTWGLLRLTLRPDDYDWRFLPVRGRQFTDRGTGTCS
jgi:acid phosphatase type 7